MVRVTILMMMAILGSGCTLINKSIEAPLEGIQLISGSKKAKTKIDPVALQADLLRYTNNFISAFVNSTTKLERDGHTIPRKELLSIWIVFSHNITSAATGSNSMGSLVDIIVLTTGVRLRIEDYWLPKIYGESARPVLEIFQEKEKQIWRIAEKLMTVSQRQELLSVIKKWHEETKRQLIYPSPLTTIDLLYSIEEYHRKKSETLTSNILSFLSIDPLAGLDPATRELAQTRLLAERFMFIVERMPQIIQWQAELLTLQSAELPEIEQVVSNTTRFADAADRLGKLAEATPGLISSERKEILQGLAVERTALLQAVRDQQPALTNLSREIGLAFGEGARMADSTDDVLKTFDTVMNRFDEESSERGAKANEEPFRIKNYEDMAAEIGRMSERLTTLLITLQTTLESDAMYRISSIADTVTDKAQVRGKEVVDYTFYRGLQLLAAAFILALAYRALSARLSRSN
jgi:hypothetical protein